MRPSRGTALATLVAIFAAFAPSQALDAQPAAKFPHQRHGELFTDCAECHAGIATGDRAAAFPAVTACASCHDEYAGKEAPWAKRPVPATSLTFAHPAHITKAGKDVTCQSCHAMAAPDSAESPMNVARATGETCVGCHNHRAPAHKSDQNTCNTCHGKVRPRVHDAAFARSHAVRAAAGSLDCAGCHAQRFCTDCHAGERTTRRYHQPNFAASHAPDAYRGDVECNACHNTQAFCRSCHVEAGRAPRAGVRSTRYHNAQPGWLLQHGRAARQDLTTCTACHQQKYCMDCHSAAGWRISPHGPDFNAERMAKRNSRICLACHYTNPLGK